MKQLLVCFILFFTLCCKLTLASSSKKIFVDSTTQKFSPLVFSQKKNDTGTVALFPFLKFDTTAITKPTYNYYEYDSLHLALVNPASSEFAQAEKINHEFAQVRPTTPEKWLFYLLLFLAALVVFVKSFYARFFIELWKSYFNFNNAIQMMRQQDISFSIPGILLSINFYMAMAILFFLQIHRQQSNIVKNQWLIIPVLLIGIVGYVFFRFFLYRFSAFLFSRKNEIQTVAFLDLMQVEFLGIILVPINLVLAFGSPTILNAVWLICYGLLSAMLIYRTVIAWRIGGGLLLGNFFHFILYICTVEIAPIMILLKIVQQWSVLK
jgi:hypothetical protein